MKKFLKISEKHYLIKSAIDSIEFRDGFNSGLGEIPDTILVGVPSGTYHITDGRTLSDIMAEIEGSEKVCRWKKIVDDKELIENPHDGFPDFIKRLVNYPYCPVCGGRIEVSDE